MEAISGNELSTVVDQIFGGGVTTYTLADGTVAEFHRATVSKIAKITDFFNVLIVKADKEKLDRLLAIVISEQTKRINEGKSVHDLDLKNSGILEKSLKEAPLLLSLFGGVVNEMQEFASFFTNLSRERIGEMELDEFAVLCCGIYAVNYSFFTQSLPLILKSILNVVNAKRLGASRTKDVTQVVKRTAPRK